MTALKLTQIGNSVGVILPKELLAKLGASKGDTITVDAAYVNERVAPLAQKGDLSRFIL